VLLLQEAPDAICACIFICASVCACGHRPEDGSATGLCPWHLRASLNLQLEIKMFRMKCHVLFIPHIKLGSLMVLYIFINATGEFVLPSILEVVLNVWILVYCTVMPCNILGGYQCFRGSMLPPCSGLK
jgi:hypothetical protein